MGGGGKKFFISSLYERDRVWISSIALASSEFKVVIPPRGAVLSISNPVNDPLSIVVDAVADSAVVVYKLSL